MTTRDQGPVQDFADVADLAARFRLSAGYIRRLLRDERIPAVKVGRRWLIPVEAADAFSDHLRAQLIKPAPADTRDYKRVTILRPVRVAGRR